MSSLLPPNASPLERAFEGATARLGDVPTPLRDLWNPDTCPADLLPWLAWALSIDAWKPYWPEHIKRARLRAAIAIQRSKGTAASVRAVVAAFGGSVQLREWWQLDPPGEPHTFEMLLTLAGEGGETATAQFVDDVIGEVSRTKPVRSHFTFTQGLQAAAGVGVVAGGRVAVCRRLQLQAVEPQETP